MPGGRRLVSIHPGKDAGRRHHWPAASVRDTGRRLTRADCTLIPDSLAWETRAVRVRSAAAQVAIYAYRVGDFCRRTAKGTFRPEYAGSRSAGFALHQWRAPRSDPGRLFERMGDLQQREFALMAADDLQADRQAVVGEAARH